MYEKAAPNVILLWADSENKCSIIGRKDRGTELINNSIGTYGRKCKTDPINTALAFLSCLQ